MKSHCVYRRPVGTNTSTCIYSCRRVLNYELRRLEIGAPEDAVAKSGNLSIAFQVVGDGDIDLVWVPGATSHLDMMWDEPAFRESFERLASFSRLILFDKRGTGLSDRNAGIATLEERMDDVRAVMDAVDSERAALVGVSEGGSMSVLFAGTYPERTTALILVGAVAAGRGAGDYPWGHDVTNEELQTFLEATDFGSEELALDNLRVMAPSVASDERVKEWWIRFTHASASPSAMRALVEMNFLIDVRSILPTIRVPTLVLHVAEDLAVPIDIGRYLAERIPDAGFVELPGTDHIPVWEGSDPMAAEIQEFLTGVRPSPESDRVLATVLFTDIVGSTEKAAEIGDAMWRKLIDHHDQIVRMQLESFRGREVNTAGDGFIATFDGPARGVRCAKAIADQIRSLGIEVRTGLHTGEVELRNDDIGGIAVHIAARVASQAGAGETLVSRTVVDLVTGSGIDFEDRGVVALKGVPGEWTLFAAKP
jgi:pimeloyl-ACP methyl ester carboxylesterase